MLSFMTYNVGANIKDHIFSAIEIIKSESPDILILNEVSWFNSEPKTLKELSLNLGFPFFHLAKSDHSFNHVALFSKFRLKGVVAVPGLQNAAIVAIVESELGDISIAGVHLAQNTENTRVIEINEVISLQKFSQNKIILGDLNSISPENIMKDQNASEASKLSSQYDVVQNIKKAGYLDVAVITKKEQTPTVPITQDDSVTYYNLRLDYIFLSNSLANRLVDYHVVVNDLTRECSDHYPIVAHIK